jgi:hypothetical protein
MKPGKHEARALTDPCPTCGQPTEPDSVLDAASGHRSAAYGCCGRWLTWWTPPTGRKPSKVRTEQLS